MNTYLLGIDIGTSACKVAVFDKSGEVVANDSAGYDVLYSREGWAEQNPNDWWHGVCRATKRMLSESGILPEEIGGVGIDGQSWAAVAIDRAGEVLTNTPIWMDTRAEDICRELEEKIGGHKIFEVAGNSLQPSYTTGKILWYQRNMPGVYDQIHKILQSNSYIVYKLTGQLTQDLSQGYGLHCFNMRTGAWDEDMCRALGISSEMLPDIYPCHAVVGGVTAEAAQACGLKEGTPVVAGGLDAACGALGSGVLQPGETQEQGGQAGGMSICMDRYKADRRLILGFHVVPDRWLLQGGTTGGGGVMRWLEREFGDYERELGGRVGKSSLELLGERAEAIPPGSDGLIFLPYMAGERSPIWNPRAKGVYYGMDFGKQKGHFIRAAMEGVAMSLRHNLETAKEAGADVSVLRAIGGSANSLLWTQIKSDITGKPIIVPSSDTATTLGAAILAGVGTGIYQSFEQAVELTVRKKREHTPDSENRKQYDQSYKMYRKLYENLKDLMNEKGKS